MRTPLLFFLIAAATVLALVFLVTQPLVLPIRTDPPMPEVGRMQEHVRILSQRFHPRSHDRPGTLAAAAAYIHAQFAATGAAIHQQEVLVEGERFVNVIARFGPDSGPTLVIGAHYDSHGDALATAVRGQLFSPETHTPGADDNASGVAGLIELAHLLAKRPPARPVELVAYTLEEPPHFRTEHMGSAWHAGAAARSARPIELMIALEMIGYFSDADGSQTYPVPGLGMLYPSKGNFVALVSRVQDWRQTRRLKAAMLGATALPVHSINAPAWVPGVDFSDHASYWNHGIPAVMVTDTAFYRNTQYHHAGDTYDRLDYRRMADVVRGVYGFILSRDR